MDDSGNQKIIESGESFIVIEGDTVRKVFKYFPEAKERMFTEINFLKRYRSPYFIEFIKETDAGFIMKNGGRTMGMNGRPKGDYLFYPSVVKEIGKEKLIKWLEGLRDELKRLNVEHRDFAPCNMVTDGKNIKLIDFTRARKGIKTPLGRDWQSPFNDEEHINRSIELLKKNVFEDTEEWNLYK